MPQKPYRILLCLIVLCLRLGTAGGAESLRFSGYDWTIKSGLAGPGPNHFEANNAFVDPQGHLHLKLTHHDGQWFGAEVILQQSLGFGRYRWDIDGPPDPLDENVVLGLFNYPTPDIGPDGTNEIDIELARWGDRTKLPVNFSVWPAQVGAPHGSYTSDIAWTREMVHTFEWTARHVEFQSFAINAVGAGAKTGAPHYEFTPADATRSIPQHPLPVHLNLWLFRGLSPNDGREVEVVIRSFQFTPVPKAPA